MQLSVWKSCGISISFLHSTVFESSCTVLTVLTAVKVFVNVLCNTHSTGILLCFTAAERAAKLD